MTAWIVEASTVVIVALAPVVGLLLARRSLGALNAAAWLTTWGAVVFVGEHAGFAVSLSVSMTELSDHARFHFFMAGAYTVVAGALLGVVAWALLRAGSPLGWYAILFALLTGGAFELTAGTTIFAHGFPPRSIPIGLFLYSYLAALASALVISYRPIFGQRADP